MPYEPEDSPYGKSRIGVTVALVTPIFYVGSVLVYVDLRVRKEGYGTQALADDLVRRPERMGR